MRNAYLCSDEPCIYTEEFSLASAEHDKQIFGSAPLRETAKRVNSVTLLLAAAMLLQVAPDHRSVHSYVKLPLAFEENRGQAPASVNYLSRTRSGLVLFRPGSVALESAGGKTIAMRFVGGRAPNAPTGEQRLPGITSYLVGDAADWVRGVPNYARIRYASIYPGIDLVFYGDQKDLEYDFVLSPGADPEQIRVAFEGVDRVAIDAEGNLDAIAAHGTMKQRKPKIWHAGPHGRREVAGRYVLSGAVEARFQIDPYDRHETLIIDPVIEYSTYFGSDRDDRLQAVTTDSTGAVYITGSTATAAMSWGFVSKMNPAGTAVMYTVFLGNGACNAATRGIAVDSGNNAIVTGYYTQKDASGACNIKQVLGAKINPAGDGFVYQLVWGGARDYGNAVAVDAYGNAYFTGSTRGNFPTTPGVIMTVGGFVGDAFITKLGPTGTPVYSTYLGDGSADEGLAIAVDTNGNAYVAGSTASSKFRTTANAVQGTMLNATGTGFVTEVNNTATQILYSTFLGGSNGESIHGIAVDGQGKIHVAGTTTSSNFPTTANAVDRTCGADGVCNPYYDGAWRNGEDAFYSKIDTLQAGTAGLMYSTFLGGTKRDFGNAIAINKNGRAWITGVTASSGDFPSVRATQATIGGSNDAFIAQIDPVQSGAASLLFSTFLGGALYDEGTGVDVDPAGNIYVVGYTGSANFPLVGALQPQTVGGNEGFVLKIAAPAAATLASITLNPGTVTGGVNSTGTVTLSAAAPAGGAVVTLTSNNINAATVPVSVTVAAGAVSATFAVTTKRVTTDTSVNITANYSGASKVVALVLKAPLTSLSVNPVSVTGGAVSTGTVTLSATAPEGGRVVTLVSNNINAATVPASVTVAVGARNATFAITSKAVTAITAVTITATYNGASKTATLALTPPTTIAALALNPPTVTGGAGSTGTVTLAAAAPAGGAVITLTRNNVNAAAVPASVTVAANATSATFAITSKPVAAATAVIITASYKGLAKTATLAVSPFAALASVSFNSATMIFGSIATGTVALTSPAPAGGAVIALSSSDWVSFYLPASVTIAAGATSAQFTVSTAIGRSATTITATYKGVTKTAILTSVYPTVVALTCNPNPVIAEKTTICTVTLNGIMPSSTTVWILSDEPFFAPAAGTVTVPAGANKTTFSITPTLVPDKIVAHISANALATATVTTPLTINLTDRGRKWVLNNVAFKGGGTASGYFIYDAATAKYLAANIRVTPGPDPNNPMGHTPEDLYYYPWPNGWRPTFADDWSTGSLLSLQNPVTETPASWTLLQLIFAQPLTNAGGTIPLVVNPNVAYTPYCTNDPSPFCTPPPANISQERFALPPNPWVVPGYYFRVVASGTVTAQ